MPLGTFVSPNAILPALKVANKKQALLAISERAAFVSGLDAKQVFDALWEREALGSTGVGNGVAIPHCQLAPVGRMFGVFARLDRAIDYDATDGSPVDLMFVLIGPEGSGADHLKALSKIARSFRDTAMLATLRATRDAAGIFTILSSEPESNAA